MLSTSKSVEDEHASNLTYGLNRDWVSVIRFAQKHDVLPSLFLLIDVLHISNKVSSLGVALRAIATPLAFQLLSDWAQGSEAATHLYKLSFALGQDKIVLENYPPLTDQESAAKQLHGELEIHFLLALLLERIPPGNFAQRAWYETLRLWILVNAVERSLSGNVMDGYVRTASSHLRLASDKLDRRLDEVNKIATSANDWGDLCGMLVLKLQRKLEREKGSLDSSVRDFFKVLKSIALGEHKPDEHGFLKVGLWERVEKPTHIQRIQPVPIVEPVESGQPEVIESLDDDGNTTGVEVDPHDSYTVQRINAGAVLLATIEESQYLPWSWDRPNPDEIQRISDLVNNLLNNEAVYKKLLGAYIWIALHTGRSLWRVGQIRLSTEVAEEWMLDVAGGLLRRLPPMRKNGWRPGNQEQEAWVHPVVTENIIELDQDVVCLLRLRVGLYPSASNLQDLWDPSWETVEQIFQQETQQHLSRVTPGMLGGVLPQICFMKSRDEVFAKLAAAHPRSGLPAASAYANWKVGSETLTNSTLISTPDLPTGKTAIVMGSRLDPLEERLVDAVSHATNKMQGLQGNYLETHNLATSYILLMLFAATGNRPVNDPFESITHFDFEHHFVYIDDKANETGRNARLVPLPERLSRYIHEHYLSHLRALGRLLEEVCPVLSQEILAMADGRPTGNLPFFFMLEHDQGLRWTSVRGGIIFGLGLLECPLPSNLFRQRLDKQLRRRGVEDEIIAGVLGHADAGSESYSDFSMRVWADDAETARPALRDAWEALPFKTMAFNIRGPIHLYGDRRKEDASILFGGAARELARKRFNINAVRLAKAQIDQFLKGRGLHTLDSTEVDQLSRIMLFNDKGLPRSNGGIRYEYLLREIERVWSREGKRFSIRKRYVVPKPKSPFNHNAPGAGDIISRSRAALAKALAGVPASRLTLSESAIVAPLLLILEGGIADRELLMDISQGKGYRLVSLNDHVWIEIVSPEQMDVGDVPVLRRRVSRYCARLLARIQSKTNKHAPAINQIPHLLSPLVTILTSLPDAVPVQDGAGLIKRLAASMDQFNVMALPGILAGYLADRVESASLCWSDWLRIEKGYPVQIPEQFAEGNEDQPVGGMPIPLAGNAGVPLAGEVALLAARQFCKELRECFDGYRVKGSLGAQARRDLESRLEKILQAHGGKISGAVLLLGRWVISLLTARRRGQQHYAVSSILRYLSALAPRFIEVAATADLIGMEDDEITDIYRSMLEGHKGNHQNYVANRLMQFHAFARGQGVEDPYWDEMAIDPLSGAVSPGLISEAEYLVALQLLQQSRYSGGFDGISLAMLLLLCYRFGLRSKEALGLMRSEWPEYGQYKVVLVQNNRIRTLKGQQKSRRQVPLLFDLTVEENEIISRHMARLESQAGPDADCPLFHFNGKAPEYADMQNMRALVIAALKLVTNNPRTNLHHARHTAANRVAICVFGLNLPGWDPQKFGCCRDAEKILLGTTGPTRRKSWATARYLGHVVQATQFRSYLHFLSDWADATAFRPLDKLPEVNAIKEIICLDEFPRLAVVEGGLLQPPSRTPTPRLFLELIRLVSMGKPWESAASLLQLSHDDANAMMGGLDDLVSGVYVEDHPEGKMKAFLQTIKPKAWDRLISFIGNIKHVEVSERAGEVKSGVTTLKSMAGFSRQLLMWDEPHFRLARAMIDYYRIPYQYCKVVLSNRAYQGTADLAHQYLTLGPEPDDEEKDVAGHPCPAGKFQLDVVRTSDSRYHVESRCAISFQRNQVYGIRTSYEFILLFGVFAVWYMLRSRRPQPS